MQSEVLPSGYEKNKDHNQVKYIENQNPAFKIYLFHTAQKIIPR